MPASQPNAHAWFAVASAALVSVTAFNACSSNEPGVQPGPSTSGASNAQSGSANDTAGSAQGGGGVAGSGTSGASTGGAGTGGVAGAAGSGGSGGLAGGAGTGGGLEPGDTPPWRPLDVIAAEGEHVHGQAGLDNRSKLLGKLVVDIGVNSGGYVQWLAKRGYHSIGAPCGACPAPNLEAGRDEVGTCRQGEFATSAASVKKTLTDLQKTYPEEDWGYFLNQDGSVRWSDVAITGLSHGATTATLAGHIGERMWRVVARSGPRDNTCGGGKCAVPLSAAAYDGACMEDTFASWLDQPSKTPINRFYGLVGTDDDQCGDIMFHMKRTKFIGSPVIWNVPGAVLTGTNQFFSTEGGHYDFLKGTNLPMNTEAVLNIAFAIPPENQNPAF